MWDKIARELYETLNFITPSSQCENKCKVLDRRYKKKSTGRGRKYFDFYEKMQYLGQEKVPKYCLLVNQYVYRKTLRLKRKYFPSASC